MKKRLGLMGLFTGLNFMAMPLILFLALNNAKTNRDLLPANGYTIDLNDVFSACTRLIFPLLVLPLSLLLVIILSVLLYGYMHQKRSVDLFHSLPVRRGPLLGGRFLAGVVMLAVPLAVSFLVSLLLCLYFGLDAAQYLPYLGKAFAWILFISVVCFLFSTLMAVCSGTTFDMVISIVVISVTYPLLIVLARMVAGMLLPGLMVKNLLGSVVTTALSPFAAAFIYFVPGEADVELGSFGPAFVVWWVFLAAVMAVVTVVLYRKRKSECAESNFAFPLPKIFIRFIATGAAGFACALIFFSALNSDASFWVGLLAGSLAAHIIAEAVYGRGFKGLKRSFGYYGVFLVAFAVYYGILATGAFGFDTRIPTASRVTSVEINVSDIVFSSSGYNGNFQNTEFTVWSK
ncbi:MAG TPA: ABC transporter permease, partial [Ruminococcaceae bacterium]|nr:ABC transporter permease [Oscillospiraceae bacterium]